MVRELGLERCETVWSLSAIVIKIYKDLTFVREERDGLINDYTITNDIVCCLVKLGFNNY